VFKLKDRLFARNGSGTMEYTATSAAPAVSGTLIESSDFNTTMTEIKDALTQSVSKDGQTVITGDIDFDGNQLILDVDGDTSITADTDDQIDFRIGGSDVVSLNSTGILDANKNEIVSVSATASAVNEITVANAATGNGPTISATGGDTNIDVNLTPKGTGRVVNTKTVSGYVSGVTEYVENDVGVNSTQFSVYPAIGTTWESVGPTGSSATNIWTSLNSIPSGAKWVNVRISHYVTDNSSGTYINAILYGRKTGSSASFGVPQTQISEVSLQAVGAGATTIATKGMTTAKIPIDSSNRFDLAHTLTGTNGSCLLYLIGWGV